MKSRFTLILMKLLIILMLSILFFLGFIIYNEMINLNLENQVKEFVSNITVSAQIEDNSEKESELEQNVLIEKTEKIKYFYEQLEEESKIIYDMMEKNKENMKTGKYELNFGNSFSYLLDKDNGEELLGDYFQSAIEAYTYDNPDVFYIDFTKLCLNMETTTRGSKTTYRVFLNSGKEANYLTDNFYSEEIIDNSIIEIEKIREYFIQNKKSNIYENVKMIHDYLVETIEYDQTVSESNIYNIYGALVNKKSVCEGYAKTFKYLLDGLNIPCILVSGKATNSEGNTENHAWNYVKINDIWYGVDCTWDDPIVIGPKVISNLTKYKYFLKGSEKFKNTHIANGQFTENGKIFEFPILSLNNY